jgi:hypothetical protein
MSADCCPLCGEKTWVITEDGDVQRESCTNPKCCWRRVL